MPTPHRVRRILARARRAGIKSPVRPFHGSTNYSTRRAFLKQAAAIVAGAALGSGCALISPPTRETKDLNAVSDRVLHEPEILTAIRSGRSVKKVIEWDPQVKNLELGFVKERSGWIRVRGIDARSGGVEVVIDDKTRSMIHTHTPGLTIHPTASMIYASTPSMTDVFSLLKTQFNRPRFRFSHIVSISDRGKVMGYFSIMGGRRMELLSKPNRTPAEERYRTLFFTTLKELADASVNVNTFASISELVAINASFLAVFKRMHELGLRIRVTPLPGFVFKEGYFQPR